jgi:type IV pilus assembly protein PilE
MRACPSRGFTLVELLTALVVVVVLTAITIPLYRSHLLRVRRADASAALIALQVAQDRHFGRSMRYADGPELTLPSPAGLGQKARSAAGHYALELRTSADGLGYLATARAAPPTGEDADARCAQLTIDHNGQRRAFDSSGADRSMDCWK